MTVKTAGHVRRNLLTRGYVLISIGTILGVLALWNHDTRSAETVGTITECHPAGQLYFARACFLRYRYFVDGVYYSGERYFRYRPTYQHFFEPGSLVAVYFDPKRPWNSTAVSRPSGMPLLVGAAGFIFWGYLTLRSALQL